MTSLNEHLGQRRGQVEKHLEQALQPRPGFPESLRQAMHYSLLAPGKRLRPLLVVLAAEACSPEGGVNPWPAACAVEMIHTYSLIHDDLPAMDDDDLRRGMPTCHKKFGEALAILAGDALLTLAFEVLAEGYPPPTAAACCRELARASGAAGMVGGQVDDLAWSEGMRDEGRGMKEEPKPEELSSSLIPHPSSLIPSIEGLEQLHARKTGALIRASLQLGVLAAHAQKGAPVRELVERFDTYGRCLGLLFQITDDLLDVEGSAAATGKRVRKDAARGKLTYPGFLGIAESRRRAERLGQQARDALVPLGPAAERLLELVSFVLERDR